MEAYVLPDINSHNSSRTKEYTLPHVDLKKYLEKQGHARQTLSTLKQRMHEKEEKIQKLSILGRDPEFGMMKDSVVRDHQYLKSTPRSNILQVKRMYQTRHDNFIEGN